METGEPLTRTDPKRAVSPEQEDCSKSLYILIQADFKFSSDVAESHKSKIKQLICLDVFLNSYLYRLELKEGRNVSGSE